MAPRKYTLDLIALGTEGTRKWPHTHAFDVPLTGPQGASRGCRTMVGRGTERNNNSGGQGLYVSLILAR